MNEYNRTRAINHVKLMDDKFHKETERDSKKGKRPHTRSFSLKVCVYSIKEGKFA